MCLNDALENIRRNIEAVKRRFTFKVSYIDKPIEITEVNEGMARYRLMNIYHTCDMELLSEEYI